MEDCVRIVQEHYDSDVQYEWDRLERHPFEFAITTNMMDRYIKPGDRILDIGGGPGRYSIYYAQRGCDVTLVDLSSENVKFALEKAKELNVNIKAVSGDARKVSKFIQGEFDHIFVMGPMYHLLEENDRIKALNEAMSLLKNEGMIYVSFILMFAGMIFGMKNSPEMLLFESEEIFIDAVLKGNSYAGDAFTKAFFIDQKSIIPFMDKFHLEKKHIFGQEGILAPCELNFLNQDQAVIDKWLDIAMQLCEREELLSYSEHAMYIGQKIVIDI
ncbi:class I SAM-dependent methyltransferase [Sedimentibacter sp.]|uniref:class I SAM-dependent methyltransferase n=1 Tax=Sedimentibacter sp. TaxID=1960295 RepID=UPI0028996157|nr:class I SAM-dependent methyltransferase [Sedimentibacter sp.]